MLAPPENKRVCFVGRMDRFRRMGNAKDREDYKNPSCCLVLKRRERQKDRLIIIY